MSPLLADDEEFVAALKACIHSLRHLAEDEMPPSLERRIRTMSENKEFLTESEREDLSALVDLWRKRAVEKLEARVALNSLRSKFPSLFESP